MENEYIGRNFRNVLDCELWILSTTTLSELSHLHDAYVDYAVSYHTGVHDEKYYEGALRAKVIEFYRQGESPEPPPESRDLQDWQVWFVKALRKKSKRKKQPSRPKKVKLTDREKAIWDAVHEQKLTQAEVAKSIKRSKQYVSKALKNAEEKLKTLGSRSVPKRKTHKLPEGRRGESLIEDKSGESLV